MKPVIYNFVQHWCSCSYTPTNVEDNLAVDRKFDFNKMFLVKTNISQTRHERRRKNLGGG